MLVRDERSTVGGVTMATSSSPLVPKDHVEYPEFTTERLVLDVDTATDIICETVGGVTPTDTDDGRKFRSTDGRLLAILTPRPGVAGIDLHYRTAPASDPATLKSRRLWQAVQPYVD
jgi:hypothetical protein